MKVDIIDSLKKIADTNIYIDNVIEATKNLTEFEAKHKLGEQCYWNQGINYFGTFYESYIFSFLIHVGILKESRGQDFVNQEKKKETERKEEERKEKERKETEREMENTVIKNLTYGQITKLINHWWQERANYEMQMYRFLGKRQH